MGEGFFEECENNVGTTKARATLGLVRVFLGEFEKAQSFMSELENDNSGFNIDGNVTTFLRLHVKKNRHLKE